MDPFDVPRGMMGQALRNAYRVEQQQANAARGETGLSSIPMVGSGETSTASGVFTALMSLALFFTGVGLVKALAAGATKVLERLPQWAPSLLLQIACAVLVLVVGLLFYLIRERKKWVYVCMELGASVGTALVAFSTYKGTDLVLPLLASVYVAVRGFDNWGKAVKEAEEKEAAKVEAFKSQMLAASTAGVDQLR